MSGARELMTAVLGYAPTDEQLAMIESDAPATLVVAGAGSGKTETMANRVVWLCARPEGRVRPEEVLGLTFTRKAAGELAARIDQRLRQASHLPQGAHLADAEMGQPTILTYDAYAGRIVREHGLRIGIEPDVESLSAAALWQLAHDVVVGYDGLTDLVTSAESTVVQAVISLAGQMAEHLADPRAVVRVLERDAERLEALAGTAKSDPARDAAGRLRSRAQLVPMVAALAEAMERRGVLDFSQKKAAAARLARDVEAVARTERARYRAVLLDEFQDTSENQLVMLSSLFAGSDARVTAVGDPHQSIYGWRGASATTLVRFTETFAAPGRPVVQLGLATSWRNDESVLGAANEVARELREAAGAAAVPVQPLRARPGAGPGRVAVLRCESTSTEAQAVAAWVAERKALVEQQRRAAGGEKAAVPASAAVLCRRRSDFPAHQAALQAAGLDCEVVGLGGLLDTPEVTDLVALLSVVQDPLRGDRLMRLLTGPVCRLGAADVDALAVWARRLVSVEQVARALSVETGDDGQERVTLVEALTHLPPPGWSTEDGVAFSDVGRAHLDRLARAVERVRRAIGLTLPEVVLVAERELGLDIEVLARPGAAGTTGRRHLDAFLDEVAAYAATSDRPSLGGLLAWLDAADTHERGLEPGEVEPVPGVVQILTVHAAKGLEWDVVAVPAMTESRFPSHSARVRKVGDTWVGGTVRNKGWIVDAGGLPYELRGDAAGLPHLDLTEAGDAKGVKAALEEFALAGGEHSVAEERRLAYVALTRARSHLLLSSAVWEPDKTSPLLPSRFQVDVLDHLPGVEVLGWVEMPPAGQANPFSGATEAVPWPSDRDGSEREPLLRAAAAVERADAAAAARDDVELAVVLAEQGQPENPEVVLPGRLSASAVMELVGDRQAFLDRLRRPVPVAPRGSALQGTLLHARIEEHFRTSTLLALPSGLEDEEVGDVTDELWERFAASEWAERTPVDVELAVFTTLGGRRITARIDAVFREDGRYVVVDWKSGREPMGEALRRRALQLAQYRVAYARYRGVPVEDVDACFYYLSTGRTVRPRLVGEEALEAMLSG